MTQQEPSGELAIRTIAMPKDTNYFGSIFGGWLVSLMDIAALTVFKRAEQNYVTVGIDKLSFVKPIFVGDVVSCYVRITKKGNTSTQVQVEAWAKRLKDDSFHKVSEGIFTYVSISQDKFLSLP